MKSIRVNDYDMRYIEMGGSERGDAPPLVLVHGSLGDQKQQRDAKNRRRQNLNDAGRVGCPQEQRHAVGGQAG